VGDRIDALLDLCKAGHYPRATFYTGPRLYALPVVDELLDTTDHATGSAGDAPPQHTKAGHGRNRRRPHCDCV
jgi:hypothetical protein